MTTHSISAFQVTVRSAAIKKGDKSAVLDAISANGKNHDFIDVIQAFLKLKVVDFETVLINKSNRLIKVHDVRRAHGSRDISFYVRQGTFGIPGEIISSKSKKTTYNKKSEDSDVSDYFVQIRIPNGSKVGIAILHSIGNVGIKSWLSEQLGLHTNNKLTGCALRFLPLCSSIALKTYLKDAEVRSIRISNYQPESSGDVTNYLNDPMVEKDLTLKREGGFGRLLPFFQKGAKRDRLIAISDSECRDVKADITFGGRSRTISLEGSKVPKAKFYLTDEDVVFDDGLPTRKSIAGFATSLLDDLVGEVKSGG